jgi:hypothetical protein
MATPLSMLQLGNCEVAYSAPVTVLGKNVHGTGFRNLFMVYTNTFCFVIGDYGYTNTGSICFKLEYINSKNSNTILFCCLLRPGHGEEL